MPDENNTIFTLTPNDIEIEKLHPGPIIHIFPHSRDPESMVESLLTAGAFMDKMQQIPAELDEIMKKTEQPDYLIMAYIEIKRLIVENLKQAEKDCLVFLQESKNQ